ncbi:extracellular solute-binding protein [Spiractinospora alimapuensis]|uniref:extracellular solute-binding protein n=1 Tax=Spiractinospora alimapuensis TaxID=2820884 RepID=UPI0022AA6193|nr:extracellular solute-binding protein [Spiractinospora alimapuensis]QVQ52880.1 extracellular solute-binding protein [Spiractinospora alimapuensis]
MRLIRVVGAGAGLALAVTACSGGGGAAEGDGEVGGTITYWDTSDAENEGPAYEAVIADFEEEHGVTVNHQFEDFDDARDRFDRAAASGDGAPDVLRTEVGWTADFASLGYLQPLDDTPALDDVDDFLDGPWSSAQYEGTTYAVPQVTDSLALLYNADLLAEAGHDEPPTTMDDLATVAGDVSEETDADGIYLHVEGYFLLPFIFAEGGQWVDDADERITINDPEAVAGLENALDLMNSDAALSPDLGESYDVMMAAFREGDVAMIINGPWSMGDALGGPAFEDAENLGVQSLEAGGPTGGHNYSVYAGSENLETAYAFVEYMASTETQSRIAEELGTLPTRESAYAAPAVEDHPIVSAYAPVMEASQPGAWIPEAGQMFVPFDDAYEAAVLGDVSPQEALDGLADEYQALLPDWE